MVTIFREFVDHPSFFINSFGIQVRTELNKKLKDVTAGGLRMTDNFFSLVNV